MNKFLLILFLLISNQSFSEGFLSKKSYLALINLVKLEKDMQQIEIQYGPNWTDLLSIEFSNYTNSCNLEKIKKEAERYPNWHLLIADYMIVGNCGEIKKDIEGGVAIYEDFYFKENKLAMFNYGMMFEYGIFINNIKVKDINKKKALEIYKICHEQTKYYECSKKYAYFLTQDNETLNDFLLAFKILEEALASTDIYYERKSIYENIFQVGNYFLDIDRIKMSEFLKQKDEESAKIVKNNISNSEYYKFLMKNLKTGSLEGNITAMTLYAILLSSNLNSTNAKIDKLVAYMYFNIVIEITDNEKYLSVAKETLNELSQDLSFDEIITAQKMARSWSLGSDNYLNEVN